VQVPVFITMYQVVRSHEETFPSFASGGLLWFTDLTRADPYFILPILSAAILFAVGEVSARNVNPQQRRMMRVVPIVFTAFIARFPTGLFVYWVTSNTITLIQNLFVYHRRRGGSLAQTTQATRGLPARDAAGSSSPGGSDRARRSRNSRAKKAGSRKKRS
jgi:YidC/Oxa1 family membrane protein insertase